MITFNRTHISPKTIIAIFVGVIAVLSWPMISNIFTFGFSKYESNLIDELSRAYSGLNHYEEPRPKDVIGIELGRTFARVGFFRNGQLQVIEDEQGHTSIPSCVAFLDKGSPLVGFAAKERAAFDPKNTICDINFLLAANFSDPLIQDTIKHLPYSVIEMGDKPIIKTQLTRDDDNYHVTPESVIATVFGKLKTMAETQLKREISHAVVAVPSHFTNAQRDLVRETGATTGMIIDRVLIDTIVATVGYGEDTPVSEHPCRPRPYHAIIYHLEDHQSKLALYHRDGEDISYSMDDSLGGISIEKSPESSTLFSNKACNLVAQLLRKANLPSKEINEIIFTGNPSHIAKIKPAIESYVGKPARSQYLPSKEPIQPDEAIVRGIAIVAARWEDRFEGDYYSYIDVLPVGIGIETQGGVYTKIFNRGTVIPRRSSETFSTITDDQSKVSIKIFEGERLLAGENKLLGTLQLQGLPLRPRGELDIEIMLEVDTCYDLTIIVKEKESGKEETMAVELDYWSGERSGDIEEAERLKEEDELALEKLKLGDQNDELLGVSGVQKKKKVEENERIESDTKGGWWSWLSGGEKHEAWRDDGI